MKLFRPKRNGGVTVVFPSRWLHGAGFVCGYNQTSTPFDIQSAANGHTHRSTFVNAASHWLGFLSTAVVLNVLEVQAADQGANFQYSPSTASIESPGEEAAAFWSRFKITFDERTDEVFADNFSPFSALDWSLKLADKDSQQLRERIPDAARNALSKSTVDSLREASLELPLMLFLKDHQNFLTDILLNSLGNVQEEAVSPLGLSYRASERSWWERLSNSQPVNYGIRPLRTNPYAFLSMSFKDDGEVFLLANARYYYDSFRDHRFELALSVPLAQGFSFDVGSSYEFGQHDEQKGLVLKLFKQLKHGGVVHAGLEAKRSPLLFAGITLPL